LKTRIFIFMMSLLVILAVVPLVVAQESGLVAFFNMDEASGSRADEIGSSDLSDNNTVGQVVGKDVYAVQFDGADYLSSSADAFDFADEDFTIMAWVYPVGGGYVISKEYSLQVLPAVDLVEYWPGDDFTGDISGIEWTDNNSVGQLADSWLINNDDNGEYLSSSSATLHPNTNDFTFSLWFKLVDDKNMSFLWRRGYSGNRELFLFYASGGSLEWYVYESNGSSYQTVSASPAFSDWHHVAVGVDQVNDKIFMYFDGTRYDGAFTSSSVYESSSDFVLGHNYDSEFYMKELAYFEDALSTSQVKALMTNEPDELGLSGEFCVNSDCAYAPGLITNTWNLMLAWHDATNDEIGLQVNGGAVYTASHSGGVSGSALDFLVGKDFTGRVDGLGVWDRVLSDSERNQIYNDDIAGYPFSSSPTTTSTLTGGMVYSTYTIALDSGKVLTVEARSDYGQALTIGLLVGILGILALQFIVDITVRRN